MDISDKAYYEELFKTHYSSLCNYAYNIVSDIDLAEDIVQNYFVYIWEKKYLPIAENGFLPYSFKSIRNSCINYYKSQLARQNFYEELLYEWNTQMEEDEESIYKEEVRKALDKLPEKCRSIFLLKFVSGLTYKEIAESSDISINTVKYHITEAYRIIRSELIECKYNLFIFFI